MIDLLTHLLTLLFSLIRLVANSIVSNSILGVNEKLGSLIKHMSSVLKWTTGSSSKLSSQSGDYCSIFFFFFVFVSLICLLLSKAGSDVSLFLNTETANVVQFENGYLVETVVEGNEIGALPYKIRVSDDGELYAVDEVNSNIIKITPPLSHCNICLHLFILVPIHSLVDSHVYLSLFMFCMLHMKHFDLRVL